MPSLRSRRVGLLLTGAAATTAAATAAWVGVAAGSGPGPDELAYVVVPHPDDEFQAWSLVEDADDRYTVFVLLTQGEETGFCDPTGYAAGFQREVEPAPVPEPAGRWSAECADARLASWRGFLTDMAAADPTLPGRFEDLGVRGPFPGRPGLPCRQDAQGTPCAGDATARVWRDEGGRGALVVFNLGDGDLTEDEVAWAVRTVRENRADLGLPAGLPESAVIGAAYANEDEANDCFAYPHPDHVAVGEVVAGLDLGVPEQLTATCADHPEVVREATVSERSADAAFELGPGGERLGAHVRHYGWLWQGHYPLDRAGQGELFHTRQSFRGTAP